MPERSEGMSVAGAVGSAQVTGGGLAARRAVLRWSVRLFRREWRQQIMVLVLITVAVAATVLGAAVAVNSQPPENAGFGTGNHLAMVSGTAGRVDAEIAGVRRSVGAVDVIENQPLVTGFAQAAQLRAQEPAGPFGRPMLALVSGRYPRATNELAVATDLGKLLHLSIGSRWTNGSRRYLVVGTVENPQNLLDDFALVPPGTLTGSVQATVLFDASAATLAAHPLPAGIRAVTPIHSRGLAPEIIVLAVSLVGLIFVGLVAVAGFTVLAQRRMPALGLLHALGATERNVGLVMIGNGLVVGAVGALMGAAIGLGAWAVYVPHLSTRAHHRIAFGDLPWALVAAAMVLSVLTATLAARWPARSAARMPVVAALSARPVTPRALHRSALPGTVALVLSVVLLAFSGGWGAGNGRALIMQLTGLLGAAAGLLLLAPVGVAALGRVARRAPFAGRIAWRDAARYRARSGAALAATSFAVFIAVLVTLLTTGRYADPVDYFGPNLPADALLIHAGGGAAGTHAAGAIATDLHATSVLPLTDTDAALTRRTADGSFRGGPGDIYVATPALLKHYGIDPASVRADSVLLTSRPGLADQSGLALLYGTPNPKRPDPQIAVDPRVQTMSGLPTGTDEPNLVVTAAAAARLGLSLRPSGWLVQLPTGLTAGQLNSARVRAAAAGLTITTKTDAPSLTEVRTYACAAGVLVALGVLVLTVGLVRAESARHDQALSALGAGRRTRRAISAWTAGSLAVLAAGSGTAVAYVATVAFFRNQLSERMSNPPVLDLLAVLIGLPVAAALGGWIFSGRRVKLVPRPVIG
ncbi:MAG: ABC transporter permease [Jatrophihabitans sp.]|uniref:ABC transporter permease n=1 Tax=Jatrophihabitans sp. TaxID=1932789 RepID=UPI00390D8726